MDWRGVLKDYDGDYDGYDTSMKLTIADAVEAALSGKGGLAKAIEHTANGKTYIRYDSFAVTWADGNARGTFYWKGETIWEWNEAITGAVDTITILGIEGRMEIKTG